MNNNYKELEIKILNVDVEKMKEKLKLWVPFIKLK